MAENVVEDVLGLLRSDSFMRAVFDLGKPAGVGVVRELMRRFSVDAADLSEGGLALPAGNARQGDDGA